MHFRSQHKWNVTALCAAALGGLLLLTAIVLGEVRLGYAQGNPTIQATIGSIIGGPSATPQPAITAIITATPAIPVVPPTATPAPSASQTPTPQLPTLRTDQMGIQAYPIIEIQNWPILIDRAQFMGFKWLKAQVSWKELEPQPGAYAAAFSVTRDNLIYAGRRGMKIMISVVNAPDWARPADARGKLEGPPQNPQDYGNFIGALLDQWGTAYINAIEIWNEPNLIREWTGAVRSGTVYKKYFDVAYAAIRQRSASIVVITAGPAPAGDTADGSVNDRRWLTELYKAGLPINDPNLVIGVHPYGWSNAPDARCCASPSQGWDDQRFFFFLDNIEDYRQIMIQNGHAAGKLWATEFGWASYDGLRYRDNVAGPLAIPPTDPSLAWMSRLNEQQQADLIVRAFQLAQSGDLAAFMGPMVLWNLNFAALQGYVNDGKPSLSEAGFSVLNSDWAPRAAYNLLQAAPKQ